MDIITQTNRTILFDIINPEKYNLLNFMAGIEETDKSLTDEKLKEIHSNLLVKSFDEFLERFAPTIYSFFDAGSKKMIYTLEKPSYVPQQLIKEIVVDKNNQFLKTFIKLIDGKRSSNKINVDFDYETMLDSLSPKKTLNDMKRLKKDINYLAEESLKLENDSPAKLKKLKLLSKKVSETEKFYKEFQTQVALMIGTIREDLTSLTLAQKSGAETVLPALPYMDGAGEIKSISMPTLVSSEQNLIGASDATKLLVSEIENRYNLIEVSRTDPVSGGGETTVSTSPLMRELVVSAFTNQMSTALSTFTSEEKSALFNNYSSLYNTWQRDFIKIAKPIFERILGVKMFFDHYKPKSKEMNPTLLVTNTSIEDLAESANLQLLNLYLESVNSKTDYSNTIWFGIVPRIQLNPPADDSDINIEIDNEFLTMWDYTGEIEDEGDASFYSSMVTLQQLLDGIKKFRIQTFFGFQTSDDTTFTQMQVSGAEKYIEACEDIESSPYDEFAIPCFPNITLIPEDKSRVVTASKVHITEDGTINFTGELKDDFKFWMRGVYIGAEYIAAGITASVQCPSMLRTYFKKAHSNFPGVRFDVEDNDNSLRLPQMFAKEIAGFPASVKEDLDKNKFGFVFTSDSFQLDGKTTSGITALNARSMHKDNNSFKSIFKTTRFTYISRMLAAQVKRIDEKSIKDYFAPGGQIAAWQLYSGYVNSILNEGEKVEYEGIEDSILKITITSKGVSDSLEIVLSENE